MATRPPNFPNALIRLAPYRCQMFQQRLLDAPRAFALGKAAAGALGTAHPSLRRRHRAAAGHAPRCQREQASSSHTPEAPALPIPTAVVLRRRHTEPGVVPDCPPLPEPTSRASRQPLGNIQRPSKPAVSTLRRAPNNTDSPSFFDRRYARAGMWLAQRQCRQWARR